MGQGGCRSVSLQCQDYLIIGDYFSGFWEVEHLDSTVSSHVIRKMKMQFARYGIPDEVMPDNSPQFASEDRKRFSKMRKFQLITSSPHHPKSNGKAEDAVRLAKRLKAKKGSSDAHIALLDQLSTYAYPRFRHNSCTKVHESPH